MSDSQRPGGRASDELRPVEIITGYAPYAEGSVLITMGNTHVLCTATVEDRVPPFRAGKGGWVTAEYGMLPRSSTQRIDRQRSLSSGRTHEIQRLIGRSLRAVTQLDRLGEHTILLDCDVLRADGGTRTAAITGAYVALWLALEGLVNAGSLPATPLNGAVAAISVGIVDGEARLDLEYREDSRAEVDFNVVKTSDGRFIEVQGTAEGEPFDRTRLDELVDLAGAGIDSLLAMQEAAIRRSRDGGDSGR